MTDTDYPAMIARLLEAKDDGDLDRCIDAEIATAPIEDVRWWAACWLVDHVSLAWRTRNREIERAATRAPDPEPEPVAPPEPEPLYLDKYRHGTGDAGYFGCPCQPCQDAYLRQQAATARREQEGIAHRAKMTRLIIDHAHSIGMVWSPELLATGFALPDGRVVTWGTATVDEHRERIDQLTSFAAANAEAAARHHHAVQTIEQAGASCLADAVEVDA